MDFVKELSQDIPAKYREKEKEKLQTTFMEASETTGSKVKGCADKTSTVAEESTSNTLDHISNVTNFIDQSPSKKCFKRDKLDDTEENSLPNAIKKPVSNANQNSQFYEVSTFRRYFEEIQYEELKTEPCFEEIQSERLKTEPNFEEISSERLKTEPCFEEIQSEILKTEPHFEQMPCERLKTEQYSEEIPSKRLKTDTYFEDVSSDSSETESYFEEVQSEKLKTEDVSPKDQDNPYRDIVLWERLGDRVNEYMMLKISAGMSGKTLKVKYTKTEDSCECSIYIDSKKVSSDWCYSKTNKFNKLIKRPARTLAAITALEKLRKYCYTVKVKQGLGIDVVVTAVETKKESLPNYNWNGANSIETKFMIDWAGDDLRKSEQDTMDPMFAIVETQINQAVLGLKTINSNVYKIIALCRRVFKHLLQKNDILQNDIVFLNFPSEDRVLIRKIAQSIGLSARKLNKEKEKLLVSRKVNAQSFIKQLIKLGGVTKKYELVKPTDFLKQYFEKLQSKKLKTEPHFEEIQPERLKTEGEISLENQYNPYKDIVLLERPGDSVFTTLEVSASVSGKTLAWHYCQKEKVWECSVNIKSQKLQQKLSCSTSLSQGEARILAADSALEKLRKCCCTVKVNKLKTEPHFEEMPPKRLKIEADISRKDQDNPYRDIVLWDRLSDNAFHTLQISVRLSGKVLKCSYSTKENWWECCLKIGSQELSCSTNLSLSKQEARTSAANAALEKLRKYCYTVKVTEGWGIDPVVTAVEIKKESLPDDDLSGSIRTEKKLIVDWPGDSFGKSDQGTVELISPIVETQISQEGCDQKIKKMHKIIAVCERLLQTDNILKCDIVFLDFPKEDRTLIYQIAEKMNLNSCAKDERKLIVSRKVDIWRLVKQLNKLGGITKKYELVKPVDEKFASLPTFMDI
ncbi:PREDICTED: uncharacterized protein LOC105452821 [Wasmannia auropunctata]|uniref:uncharacterized protein LOC105452821 n=1 Tax=Wasmannia auropunctata TaxID=64793 RepID=UPI0005F0584C|nr:PREDICTED: uncharacterized protein LOC105452821 [Wasmannia auropunctata]